MFQKECTCGVFKIFTIINKMFRKISLIITNSVVGRLVAKPLYPSTV